MSFDYAHAGCCPADPDGRDAAELIVVRAAEVYRAEYGNIDDPRDAGGRVLRATEAAEAIHDAASPTERAAIRELVASLGLDHPDYGWTDRIRFVSLVGRCALGVELDCKPDPTAVPMWAATDRFRGGFEVIGYYPTEAEARRLSKGKGSLPGSLRIE